MLQVGDDLADAEQSHGDDHEADAVRELGHAEGEAGRAGVDVGADHAEQQAEDDHPEGVQDRAVRQHDRGHEPEGHEREVLGRAEAQGDLGQRRREERDQDRRDGSGEERADRGGGERAAGKTLTRHLVAVEGGHDG